MSFNLFTTQDYRECLSTLLSERGKKKALCSFIPCQSTFLSNVMHGTANLSLEHAVRASEFFNFNEKETHYFMLLVQLGKAGSASLAKYFKKQLAEIRKDQDEIASKIGSHETIPLEDQLIFYNSWKYVAIHILCAIPEYQTRSALREYLKLPAKEIDPAIDHLIRSGLLKEKSGRITQGSSRVHLPKGSPFLIKHHANWRMKAVQSLDVERDSDLHYTLVMSLSEKEVQAMKQIIFDAITRTDSLLKNTGDEVAYSFCIDWFKL